MKKNRFLCPKCNFWLSPSLLRSKPYFQCPSCAEKLCISETYMRALLYAGLLLGFTVPAILQIQNPFIFIGLALLAWLPANIAFTTFLQFVYPPRITFYSSGFSDPLSLTHRKKDGP
jgi:hypothetical protein